MGGILNRYQANKSHLNVRDRSLKNQTFNIQGHAFTLIDRLGGGAFGSVWSAVSRNGHPAAIKTIDVSGRTASDGFDPYTLMESFQKEIKMAYKMRQETQHVVTIYGFDFDTRTGLALMAMELGGDTLTKRIEKLHVMTDMKKKRYNIDGTVSATRDYISSRERKNIWIQLVNIVQTLHRHHVIHRDMKPDNLVFFGPIMKIVDLGIAQKEVIGDDPNATSIGTPYFSAPECFQEGARISSKADIWSAGAILYYMTYGEPPLEGSSRPPPDSHPTRSAHVEDVLNHCLRRNSQQRGSHSWLARHPYTNNPMVF